MRTATLTPLAAALAIACADGATTPASPQAELAAAAAGTPSPAQTGAQTAAQSADTTRPSAYPSAVRVRGRVVATTWTAGRTVGDTLSGFQPVIGARVTLYRNVLVDGRGVSQRIGERETGVDGAFLFEDVPGGPYVLALNVTPERPYGETLQYVMGNAPEVSATLRMWLRASVPTDSTRGP